MKLPWGASWSSVAAHLGTIAIGMIAGAVVFGPIAKESWPAWVQAIGSVVAIFVAVLVPNRIAAKERKAQEMQRKFRAKNYAFVLLPLMESLRRGVKAARVRWVNTPGQYDDDDVAEYLGIPTSMADRMLDLHEIGESGLAIQNVVIATTRLKEGVHYQYAHWRYAGTYYNPQTGEEEDMPEPDDVDALFTSAQETAEAAVTALANVMKS